MSRVDLPGLAAASKQASKQAASSTREMAKNHNSVVELRIQVKFWWMIPMGVKYNHTKFEQETQRWRPGTGSHKQQSLDRNHLRRQSETVLWPSAMDEYRITCSKVSVPPRGNTIDWFPLTHTTHHHPQQCRLCRYNRRTQPARPREPSYMHQVTDSPPPAENKLQSSAARQRRSPESHTRRELARVSATS